MSHPSIEELKEQIAAVACGLRPVQLMEICGTHTVALFRSGVKSLLPPTIRMVSGPGCPVCVTSQGYIDAACEASIRPEITVCTYGDMVRVPGRTGSLEKQRARGAQVVIVYSARDAVKYAADHPDRQVLFLAVGFETTAPATAAAVLDAQSRDLRNFFILPGHKLVIPAMTALLSSGDIPIDGFLCPGHVTVVIGSAAYRPVAQRFGKPCVVTGFEAGQMLLGLLHLLEQIARGESRVENVYGVAATEQGNLAARECLAGVFEPADTVWRAMGTIPASGLELRPAFKRFDAVTQLGLTIGEDYEQPGCRCGEVIQGKLLPPDCGLFGKACTPTMPVGPCMVSSEGTCAAWYKYGGARFLERG
ncbi:MAG: hydrogenase formation protein HypD [Planctomycetes bacterium]|nr:hydrogenase formation protein HypD [Planctomycetota bacterium]